MTKTDCCSALKKKKIVRVIRVELESFFRLLSVCTLNGFVKDSPKEQSAHGLFVANGCRMALLVTTLAVTIIS
ncbi:unnamed protein product [Nippostrongylus brasiliensis]|uniref:Ovule protein n=1 Tax=Nippostrongylus brasiliensis TaxID=27835 RepID=A0A0N4YGU0_NIPBR|nr:unnamed protein product [Nippostrongylus brasiliensis]